MTYNIDRCEDIAKHIEQINKEHPYITERPLPADHIFDEDKSVKWNRIEVQRWNDTIREKRRLREESRFYKMKLLEDDIIEYIYQYLDKKCSYDRCKIFYEKLYSEFEYSLYEGKLDSILDMIRVLLTLVD